MYLYYAWDNILTIPGPDVAGERMCTCGFATVYQTVYTGNHVIRPQVTAEVDISTVSETGQYRIRIFIINVDKLYDVVCVHTLHIVVSTFRKLRIPARYTTSSV